MNEVYMIAGGVTKFAKAHPEKSFQVLVKEAFDYALGDVGMETKDIDGSVSSYFSDHFLRQLMGGAMVQDYLGLCPKPGHRVEGGGATGGLGFQAAWREIASGRMKCCAALGWETMAHVNTWKGNEFIALASDTNFDYPVGGFYTGYYAMMAVRHMHEFRTTPEQFAMVSVKNHKNAEHNPYAQYPGTYTVKEVRSAPMVSYPLTLLDICTMSEGAAVALLCDKDTAFSFAKRPVRITGVGTGTDAMRMADRPHGEVMLLPHEKKSDYAHLKYPGVHSFRAGRAASRMAYEQADIKNPLEELDFVELHDAYTSSEIQTYEDMGLCRYGEGGPFVETGAPFMPKVRYGLEFTGEQGVVPVNPSGGLLACGHPVGATGLMQSVFALWQLQGTVGKHFRDDSLQLKDPRRGAIHSHAGTGTYVAVSVLERGW
ncbi:thiolase domain-containing protein [Candidatus Woesearchaeota archaeon]|nr:thiolase domain-containing protein [Candidatus Woesearchaeota archaeon]